MSGSARSAQHTIHENAQLASMTIPDQYLERTDYLAVN